MGSVNSEPLPVNPILKIHYSRVLSGTLPVYFLFSLDPLISTAACSRQSGKPGQRRNKLRNKYASHVNNVDLLIFLFKV